MNFYNEHFWLATDMKRVGNKKHFDFCFGKEK